MLTDEASVREVARSSRQLSTCGAGVRAAACEVLELKGLARVRPSEIDAASEAAGASESVLDDVKQSSPDCLSTNRPSGCRSDVLQGA